MDPEGLVEVSPVAQAVKPMVAGLPVVESGVVAASGVYVEEGRITGHVDLEVVSARLLDHLLQRRANVGSQIAAVNLVLRAPDGGITIAGKVLTYTQDAGR